MERLAVYSVHRKSSSRPFNIRLGLATLPPNAMSSNSHPDTSSSQFRAIFDAALVEYTRKTGKNIDADPLTAKLRTCTSPSGVYAVLQEQAQKFDEFRNGGRKGRIMEKLKPIVDVLLTLSNGGALGNGIDLVSTRPRSLFSR